MAATSSHYVAKAGVIALTEALRSSYVRQHPCQRDRAGPILAPPRRPTKRRRGVEDATPSTLGRRGNCQAIRRHRGDFIIETIRVTAAATR
jgi:hypothetical protein